jgi:hypothetical protein
VPQQSKSIDVFDWRHVVADHEVGVGGGLIRNDKGGNLAAGKVECVEEVVQATVNRAEARSSPRTVMPSCSSSCVWCT